MKIMKKFPGGILLVPMFISALLCTFLPNIFKIGGITESFFGSDSLNFILGATIFISGCSLKLSKVTAVLKRYGVLLVLRTLICAVLAVLFYKIFGLNGFLGISFIAFICTITSINPSLFLAIMEDCGDEIDEAAFGLISVFATPVVTMIVFSLTQPASIDFMPIVSMLVPLILGIILGNLDDELSKFLLSGMPFMIFALGWSVGTKINLLEACMASFSGFAMTVLYYLFTAVPLFFIEMKLLKRKGMSSLALSTMAGLSASIPFIIARDNPTMSVYVGNAVAIVTFGVVITSIISPFLAKKLETFQK